MKTILVLLLSVLSGCTSISLLRNGVASGDKYIFVNTNKAGENRLLIQFLGDSLLVKNMKNENDTSISAGEDNVYSVNDYIISSDKISFRIRSLEPCQIALTNNKHPFYIAAQTDLENKQHCSIRYRADLKKSKKVL